MDPKKMPATLLPAVAASPHGLLIWSACLVEDAFISVWPGDNFINRYGLQWDISERIQTYTHSL